MEDESAASLRNQVNEANSRWRREEKRAKAREEELEHQLQAERARNQELAQELAQLKKTSDDTKDKLRESNKKRLQVQTQSQQQLTELEELRPFKLKCDALQAQITASGQELENQVKLVLKFQSAGELKDSEMVQLKQELTTLMLQVHELKLDVQQAAGLKTELQAGEDKLEAMKIAMKHNAQLVRDLKSELAKTVNKTAVTAVEAVPPTIQSAPREDKLIKDLANRLESLLTDNASLVERVRYLESTIHDLQSTTTNM
ncbi:hypothetical protein BASA81_000507 [Batrachochytrium salamandrivorans]|nr:hypothetical protein BASA81_000507 [Batrachochytrium salamandrivorans]